MNKVYRVYRCSDMGDRDIVATFQTKEEAKAYAEKLQERIDSEGLEEYCWYVVV